MVWTCGTDGRGLEANADNGSSIRGEKNESKTKENLHGCQRDDFKKTGTGVTELRNIVDYRRGWGKWIEAVPT